MTFWNTIVETNTFNFAILLIIFAVLSVKMNFSGMLEKLKKDIIDTIENAKSENNNAKLKLKEAKNLSQNLQKELNDNSIRAEEKANAIEKQIIDNANKLVSSIENSARVTIESEEKTINTKISKKTLSESTKLAEFKIKKMLNPSLHDRIIEESIGEL